MQITLFTTILLIVGVASSPSRHPDPNRGDCYDDWWCIMHRAQRLNVDPYYKYHGGEPVRR